MTHRDEGEQRRQTLRAYTVLVGDEHPSPDARFDRLTFSLDGLSQWISQHHQFFDSDHSADDDGTQTRLVVRDPLRISMSVPDGELLLFSGVGERSDSTSRVYETTTSWAFTPTTPLTFDELWYGIVRPLKYLLVLVTGEPTVVDKVSVRVPASSEVPEYERVSLEGYLATSRHHLPEKRRSWEWLVPLDDIVDDLSARVHDWVVLERRLRTVLPLLFAVLEGERQSYLES